MEIQKEYLDLNDNFSYHKASAADWRGIGYTEIPTGADIFFMEWFYKETQEGRWLVWDKHQDCWKPCDYDFREGCPNIYWKREGVTLKKALDRSISNQAVPEGFVLVEASELESLKSDNEHFTKSCIDWTERAYKQRAKVDQIKNEVERFKQSGTSLDLGRFLDNLIEFSTFKHDAEFDGFVLVPVKEIKTWYLDDSENIYREDPEWLCDIPVGEVVEVEHRVSYELDQDPLFAAIQWDEENSDVGYYETFKSKAEAEKVAAHCKAMVEAQEQSHD